MRPYVDAERDKNRAAASSLPTHQPPPTLRRATLADWHPHTPSYAYSQDHRPSVLVAAP
jgi:hypothetical protein